MFAVRLVRAPHIRKGFERSAKALESRRQGLKLRQSNVEELTQFTAKNVTTSPGARGPPGRHAHINHVTLAAENKTMRCEADVKLFGKSLVAADHAIVVETQADLFAIFLCNPHLWSGLPKAFSEVALSATRPRRARLPAAETVSALSAGSLRYRWCKE